MSVYTRVLEDELSVWLKHYGFNEIATLEPIAEGITNTNYFVIFQRSRFVLTLFEALPLKKILFYLKWMQHLSQQGISCPQPLIDQSGALGSMLSGKPACLVTFLPGKAATDPTTEQCLKVGRTLAHMHLCGESFPNRTKNPRGLQWWNKTAHALYPRLSKNEAKVLRDEMNAQNLFLAKKIPKGIIHADLFKDNVLIDKKGSIGVIDFYYACYDYWIYDIAIAVNSWAQLADGEIANDLATAFLSGYQSVRVLSKEEMAAWPIMLRAAALRFWLSRLQDRLYPTPGELTYTKDPAIFYTMLVKHKERSEYWL